MAKRRWLFDHKVGKWRHGGRYASRPPRRALRRDKAGRYIDDAGKRVPESALAPTRKAAKKKAHVKPKKPAKKKPRLSKAAQGALKRFREQLAAGPRGTPEKRAAPAKPEIERIVKGETIVKKELLSSSWSNKKPPDNLSEVQEAVLERAAAKGPFQPDDIVVYEHGIKFVGHEKLTPEMIATLSGMAPKGGHIKYADTKAGTEVYVYMGDAPKVGPQVSKSYDTNQEQIDRIYRELVDYWGEADWYVWFETEESIYG